MSRMDFNIKDIVGADNENEIYIIVANYPEIDYTLVYRNSEYQPWVAAWAYRAERKCWGQGHYFSELEDALQYIMDLKTAKGVA